MAVRAKDPVQREDDLAGLWSRVGEQLVHGHAHFSARIETDVADLKANTAARFDRLETDVVNVKADVADVRADLAGVKADLIESMGQLNRLEVATGSGFDRMDTRFDELVALVVRDHARR